MPTQYESLLATFEKNLTKQRELFLSTVENLAKAICLRDAYTGRHSQRVARFAFHLGQQLRLSREDLAVIGYGAPLHDLGKIGVADAILRKPGPLTPEEFDVMKTHTTVGAKIVELVPDLRPAVAIVRWHHERWDGHGYPDGLAGEDIPLAARIVAVAEGFDAMVIDTPYRKGMPVEEAFAELEKQQGRQYDPNVIAAFLRSRERVVETMESFKAS
ncbi:MAG TPA: HD domain-containing phosphohydrolase [Gemmataceae bacterium]|nr:HD domain-containing phosphohydrolase [Gemmataceae bacterium]